MRHARQPLDFAPAEAPPAVPAASGDDWERLAEAALEGNPFFAPSRLRAAIAHLGHGRVEIVRAEDGRGRLLALAPVRRTRFGRLAAAISVWTHPYGPLGTPLLDPARADEAAAALVPAVEAHGSRLLLFPDLPRGGAVAGLLEAEAANSRRPLAWIDVRQRAVLSPPASAEGPFRDGLARRKRKELGRQMRRLAETGALSVETITEPASLSAAFAEFMTLEAAGWKGRRGTALSLRADARAFATDAVRSARSGETAIDAIRIDGRAVAMLVRFRSGSTVATWKIAHDESLARFSPGVQVMILASDALIADPTVRHVDSLAAEDHPMIDALWPERMEIGTLAIGSPVGSLSFRAGLFAARAEAAARRNLRRRLRGGAGQPSSRELPA